jgi:hypothetical protein
VILALMLMIESPTISDQAMDVMWLLFSFNTTKEHFYTGFITPIRYISGSDRRRTLFRTSANTPEQ